MNRLWIQEYNWQCFIFLYKHIRSSRSPQAWFQSCLIPFFESSVSSCEIGEVPENRISNWTKIGCNHLKPTLYLCWHNQCWWTESWTQIYIRYGNILWKCCSLLYYRIGFFALLEAPKVIFWLRRVMEEVVIVQDTTKVNEDNSGTFKSGSGHIAEDFRRRRHRQ